MKMAEAQTERFGENKEEVSAEDYEEFKKNLLKFKSKGEEEITSPGYVIFHHDNCEAETADSTEMDACAKEIYKSLGDIYDAMKKITNDEITQDTNDEAIYYELDEKVEEPIYDELKLSLKHDKTIDEDLEAIQEDNEELCMQEEDKVTDSQKRSEEINGKTDEVLYENIGKTSDSNRITIQKNKDSDQMVEIVTECLNCRDIITSTPKQLLKDISATKKLMKSYQSKVEKLEKENKNASSALNSICAELEDNKIYFRLSSFFSKRKPLKTPTTMSQQIKTISEYIQKNQYKEELLQKNLRTAQEEIQKLKQRRKSRIWKIDRSTQVDEEYFKAYEREEKMMNLKQFLQLEGRLPTNLKIQLEDMKLQFHSILSELQVSQIEKTHEDTDQEEKEDVITPVKNLLGDKEEVLD